MMKILFVALGGVIGALLRYAVSDLTYKWLGNIFPWGTLSVNLAGAFFIGFLWEFSERMTFSPELRLLIFIGIIGSFTTFSTYCFDTFNLFRDGKIKLALSNILISNLLGLALVLLGFISSRYVINFLGRK